MAARRLIRNAIQCNACGSVIESRFLHDLMRCQCGQASVDGGLTYVRRTCGAAGYVELAKHEIVGR